MAAKTGRPAATLTPDEAREVRRVWRKVETAEARLEEARQELYGLASRIGKPTAIAREVERDSGTVQYWAGLGS